MVPDNLEGFLLVDKPSSVTSYYCVDFIKRIIGRKIKVGHAGTLDAFATGLLIIGISRAATKAMTSLIALDKRYIATGKLGQLTETLDLTGTLLQEDDISNITHQKLIQAIQSLGKQYKQTPPIYSALKYHGRPLSYLARKKKISYEELKKIAEEKSKIVHIYSIELHNFSPPFFTISVHVSHGTYIRSLINDIAQKLDTYAATHELQRPQIGPFMLPNAIALRSLKSLDDIHKHLISLESMQETLSHYKQPPFSVGS